MGRGQGRETTGSLGIPGKEGEDVRVLRVESK